MRKLSCLLLLSAATMLASCGTLSIIVNSEVLESSLSMPNDVREEVVRLDLRALSLPPVSEEEAQPNVEALSLGNITA